MKKFKKGDFVSTLSGSWTFIIKEPINDEHAYVYAGCSDGELVENTRGWFRRLATPKEKKDLLNLLAQKGLYWDEENLELINEI